MSCRPTSVVHMPARGRREHGCNRLQRITIFSVVHERAFLAVCACLAKQVRRVSTEQNYFTGPAVVVGKSTRDEQSRNPSPSPLLLVSQFCEGLDLDSKPSMCHRHNRTWVGYADPHSSLAYVALVRCVLPLKMVQPLLKERELLHAVATLQQVPEMRA